MSEPEKALLINVGIAIVMPVLIPLAFLVWVFLPRGPRSLAYRRALGLELLIAGCLYALVAVTYVVVGTVARAPHVPSATPRQVFTMEEAGSSFASGLLVYDGQPHEFDVTFSEKDVDPADQADPDWEKPILKSIGGRWSGSNAALSIDGETVAEGEATQHESDWPSSLPEAADFEFKPAMHVSLPVDKSWVHRTITVTASMDVDLPYSTGDKRYSVAGTSVSRSERFFVITSAEADMRLDRSVTQNRAPIIGFGVVLLLGSALVARKGWRLRHAA